MYLIQNADDLKHLSEYSINNSCSNLNFMLTNDITNVGSFTPIGSLSSYFAGIIDGKGHSISDVDINSNIQYVGLISKTDSGCSISNLTIKNSSITENYNNNNPHVAGFVGRLNSNSTVTNCRLENVDITGSNGYGGAGGGIAGLSYGDVTNCVVDGCSISRYNNPTGGIVGNLYSSSATVNNCYVHDTTITQRHSFTSSIINTGAVVGYINDNNSKAYDCYYSDCVLKSEDDNITSYHNLGVGGESPADTETIFEAAYNIEGKVYKKTATFMDNPVYDTAIIKYPLNTYLADGTQHKPVPLSVTTLNGTELTLNTDYELIYSSDDDSQEGVYTLTVRGKGSWQGEETFSYTIGNTCIRTLGNHDFVVNSDGFYLINSIDDMNALSTYSVSNSCENLKFMLMKDLNYTNQTFNPIGMNSSPYFKGIFDGNKHVISNISYIKNEEAIGLFRLIGENASVRNLTLTGIYFENKEKIENKVCAVGAVAAYCLGTIENCSVNNTILKCVEKVGGITGILDNNSANIRNCLVGDNTSIESTGSSFCFAGGIVGAVYRGSLLGCLSKASISGDENSDVGGIVGYRSTTCTVKNCLADGVKSSCESGALFGNIYNNNNLLSNYYINCKVNSNSVTTSGVGCIVDTGNTPTSSDLVGACPAKQIQTKDGVTASFYGTPIEYNVSGITGFENTAGIVYDGKMYAGKDESVNLNLTDQNTGATHFTTFSGNGSINGSSAPYTLKLADENPAIIPLFTITYVLNQQNVTNNNPATYTKYSGEIILNDPVLTGSIFKGWYNNEEMTGEPVTCIPDGSNRDKTFYAKWETNNYTLVFHKNWGDTDETVSQTFSYDEEKELTANSWTVDEYVFVGWTTNSDGTGTKYTDKQVVSKLSSVAGDTIHLYAQWKLKYWGIPEGATGSKNNPYLIKDIEDLKYLSNHANHKSTTYFRIENDIVLPTDNASLDESGSNFKPISGYNNRFCSVFDGNGKTIKGLRIKSNNTEKTNYIGLFGDIYDNATIKNLTVENSEFSYYGDTDNYETYIGAIVAEGSNNTHIINCTVKNVKISVTGNVKAQNLYIGGITAYHPFQISSIEDCTAIGVEISYPDTILNVTNIGAIAGHTYDHLIKNNYYLNCKLNGTLKSSGFGFELDDFPNASGLHLLDLSKFDQGISTTAETVRTIEGISYYGGLIPLSSENPTTGYHTVYSVDGNEIENDSFILASDNPVVTKQQKINNYTVRFDSNNATDGTMDDQVFNYEEEASLTENTYSRTNYSFTG